MRKIEIKVYNTPNLQREAYVTLDGSRVSPILPNHGVAKKWADDFFDKMWAETQDVQADY